uniref:Uncharacterized protein n=1 Tax=Ditylenchus dipsaci TaxID=166011 RepID=A0A915DQG0_9BILA
MSLDDSPPPEQSCSLILDKNVIDSDNFEAISITFRLDNISDTQFDFPERIFRQEIANAQHGRNPSVPFKESDLFDTRLAVKRINTLTKIAGLEVTGIDKVKDLYAVESYTNNTNLIIEACLAALFIFATCICGCWIACKNKGNTYDDELQKV